MGELIAALLQATLHRLHQLADRLQECSQVHSHILAKAAAHENICIQSRIRGGYVYKQRANLRGIS
jgi:hypothetical protein